MGVVWRGAWGWYGRAAVAAVGDWGSGGAAGSGGGGGGAGADTDAGSAAGSAAAAAAGDSEAVGRLEPGGQLPYAAGF